MQTDLAELKKKLETADGKERIEYYLQIGNYYIQDNGDNEALKFLEKGFEYAKQEKIPILMAKSLFLIGNYYKYHNLFDKAIKNYLLAIQLYESQNADLELSKIYLICGTVYWQIGNYANSLDFYFSCIKKKEKLNDIEGIAECDNNIGLVYWKLRNFDRALEYFFKSLIIKQKTGRKRSIARTLNNIGNIYYDLDDIEESLKYHQKSYIISKEVDSLAGLATALNNIGSDYKKLNKLDKSLEYLFKSLKLKLELHNNLSTANTYKNIGKIYRMQRKCDEALKYLQIALKMAEDNESKLVRKDCYFELADVYESQGNLQEALNFKNKYIELTESIYKDMNNKKISDLEIKISVEHMLRETETIKQKNIELQHEINERKKTGKTLKSYRNHLEIINRILRHDILNKLSAIQSSVRLFRFSNDEKYFDEILISVHQTSHLIYKMKNLESYLLTHDDLKIVDLRKVLKELLTIFPDKKIEIYGSGKVFADEAIISVFENLINNAFIHGKTEKIIIEITNKDDTCIVSVIDFGIGIPDEYKDKIFEESFIYGETGQTGLGLYIVKQVIERYGGNVIVEDNQPTGTIFKFTLKEIK